MKQAYCNCGNNQHYVFQDENSIERICTDCKKRVLKLMMGGAIEI